MVRTDLEHNIDPSADILKSLCNPNLSNISMAFR